MKRVLTLLVAAIMLCSIDVVAQSRSSYFMEGSYFRNDFNPAITPTRGYIALPAMSGLGMNMSTNFLSIDNFLYQRNGEIVTALHGAVSTEEFLGKLPSVGKLSANLKTNILGVGFYVKKSYWTFGLNANVSADMAMSMDVFKALKSLGNGVYDLGDTALEADAYMDAYIGTSFRVCDFINVGVKAKFLVGIANARGQFSQLYADVLPESVSGQLRGTLRASGIFIDNSTVQGGSELPLDQAIVTDPSYMLSNFKNYGFALDLGAEVRLLDDNLKLSAAITDLGFIKWSAGSHISGSVVGDFYYKGFNFETQEADADGSFEMIVDDPSGNKGYSSMLNCSLNIGAEYNILNNHIAFGLLSHTKFCNTMTYSELTASVNFRPTNWLSATVSHTFLNHNKFGIFGFALNIHPRVINIYVGADFIGMRRVPGPAALPVSLPRYNKSFNVYAGIGFNFGRPKFMRE